MFVLICTDSNNMHDSISACGVGCKACTRKDASSECTECNDGFRRKATADKDCDRKSYFLNVSIKGAVYRREFLHVPTHVTYSQLFPFSKKSSSLCGYLEIEGD